MPAHSKVSDDQIRELLEGGVPQSQVALACHMTEGAISKRIKAMETKAAAKAPEYAVQAVSSMWDTRAAAEENYQRCLALIDDCETPGDKRQVLSEIRAHLQFGMQVIETLYTVQETKDFMTEVLEVIGQIDSNARDTIIRRLAEKRTLRAAFLPH